MSADDYRTSSAEHFCEIARDCVAKGDLAMARNCYDEAVRMVGDSELGSQARAALMAMERMVTTNRANDAGDTEECEPAAGDKPTLENTRQSYLLYRKGEHCEKAGDPIKALEFYQKAVETCPDCNWGLKAKCRMSELEEIVP
jgi:tetratricopeptide (TPR) repeat protein